MLCNDGDFVSYSSEDTSLDSLLAGGIIDLVYWNYLCNFILFGIYLNLRTFVFLNIGNWFVLNLQKLYHRERCVEARKCYHDLN